MYAVSAVFVFSVTVSFIDVVNSIVGSTVGVAVYVGIGAAVGVCCVDVQLVKKHIHVNNTVISIFFFISISPFSHILHTLSIYNLLYHILIGCTIVMYYLLLERKL